MHSTAEAEARAAEDSTAELTIGGMTCASCAARVEKKLNRMDGVTATVNYATEKAKVAFGPGTGLADLIATVEKTGYTAQPVRRPEPPAPTPPPLPQPPLPQPPATATAGARADADDRAAHRADADTSAACRRRHRRS